MIMAITIIHVYTSYRIYEDEEKTHMARPGKSTLKIDEKLVMMMIT